MNIFKTAFNKVKGILTGGSNSETENESRRSVISDEVKTSKEINFLHNHNVMMNKRVAIRRMRDKMRRKTQQQQRF